MRGGRGLRRSEPSGFPAGRPFGRTVVRRKRAGVPFRTVPGRPLPVAALVRPLRLPLLSFVKKKLYGRINFSAFHEFRCRVFAIFASNPDERRPPCCCTAFPSGSAMPLPACPPPASPCCRPGSGAGGGVAWRGEGSGVQGGFRILVVRGGFGWGFTKAARLPGWEGGGVRS